MPTVDASHGRGRLAPIVVLAAWACACGGTTPTGSSATGIPADTRTTLTPVVQSAEWPASTPEAEGLDATRLTDAVNQIRRGESGRIHSLLIARHDRLVVEEYFNGWAASSAHTQQSVTKSVTSLAAGLAVDRGALRLAMP